jgi:hypothetical protein
LEAQMLLISNIAAWLDEVDLWTEQEARDLFEAVRHGRPTGLFHCVRAADGEGLVVHARHATSGLLLHGSKARLAMLEAVAGCEALAATGATWRATATAVGTDAAPSGRQQPQDQTCLSSV